MLMKLDCVDEFSNCFSSWEEEQGKDISISTDDAGESGSEKIVLVEIADRGVEASDEESQSCSTSTPGAPAESSIAIAVFKSRIKVCRREDCVAGVRSSSDRLNLPKKSVARPDGPRCKCGDAEVRFSGQNLPTGPIFGVF